MDPKQIHLTPKDIEQSTLLFGVLALLLMIPLLFVLGEQPIDLLQTWVVLAAGIFWGAIALLFIVGYWDLYYAFFYPRWMRWASPFLTPVLYAMFTMGLLSLAKHSSGAAWLWWLLLGAVEGVLEHILGVYGLRILERVPWLNGLRVGPILLFSFFEYLFYWALVGWLALGFRAGVSLLQGILAS